MKVVKGEAGADQLTSRAAEAKTEGAVSVTHEGKVAL